MPDMSECARILNTDLTSLQLVSLRSEFSIIEKSAKKNLHYFCKTLYRRCLRELWFCLRSWIYQSSVYGSGSKYAGVLHIPGFLIYDGSQYARVLNMTGFWIYQSSKYTKVLNIPEFWIYRGSEYTRVPNMSVLHRSLNVPEYRG